MQLYTSSPKFRVLEPRQGNHIGREESGERSSDNNTERSSGRKVLQLSKLKQTIRSSMSRTQVKKPQKHSGVEVKEINLYSTQPIQKVKQRNLTTQASSKRLLTILRRSTQQQAMEQQVRMPGNRINVINKPVKELSLDENNKAPRASKQQGCIESLKCELFQKGARGNAEQIELNEKALFLRLKKQRPDIHNLKVEKRQVKIVTSREFNMKRSGDGWAQMKEERVDR